MELMREYQEAQRKRVLNYGIKQSGILTGRGIKKRQLPPELLPIRQSSYDSIQIGRQNGKTLIFKSSLDEAFQRETINNIRRKKEQDVYRAFYQISETPPWSS